MNFGLGNGFSNFSSSTTFLGSTFITGLTGSFLTGGTTD